MADIDGGNAQAGHGDGHEFAIGDTDGNSGVRRAQRRKGEGYSSGRCGEEDSQTSVCAKYNGIEKIQALAERKKYAENGEHQDMNKKRLGLKLFWRQTQALGQSTGFLPEMLPGVHLGHVNWFAHWFAVGCPIMISIDPRDSDQDYEPGIAREPPYESFRAIFSKA